MNVVRVKQLKHQLCIVIYGNVRFEETVPTFHFCSAWTTIAKQNPELPGNNDY